MLPHSRISGRLVSRLSLWVGLFLWPGGTAVRAEPAYVVVANPDFPLSEVRGEDLNRLYMGETRTLPGLEKAIPVHAPDGSPAYEAFIKRIHRKTPDQLKRHWARLIFSGQGTPPRQPKNWEEVVQTLIATPNAIGYLPLEPSETRLKRLRLDGEDGF